MHVSLCDDNPGFLQNVFFTNYELFRCTASGTWSPKQPPVCTSRTNNIGIYRSYLKYLKLQHLTYNMEKLVTKVLNKNMVASLKFNHVGFKGGKCDN